MRRSIALALSVFVVGTTCAAGAFQDRPAELLPFERIFDGKTLEGWVNYKTGKAPENWVVEDGALVRRAAGGDIMTAAEYDHFELRLEWKISPMGNSGILYRVRKGDPEPYFSGPEYQVFDDAGHGLDDHSKNASAALYGLYAAEGKVLAKTGEYNRARIVVQGNHVEHWINDQKVVDTELHGDEWNALVEGSKFKEWPQFAMSPIGHIDFQDHGHEVWYRNIELRPLPPPSEDGPVFADLTPGSAQALIQRFRGSDVLVVLDVRTPGEYAAGHLPDVSLIDYQKPDFKDRVAQLDRDPTYLVYCASGGRSGRTLTLMKDLGFHSVYNMAGGWSRWSKEKRPTAEKQP